MPMKTVGDKIYPTGGTCPFVDAMMNRGMHNGNAIYIHDTSQ